MCHFPAFCKDYIRSWTVLSTYDKDTTNLFLKQRGTSSFCLEDNIIVYAMLNVVIKFNHLRRIVLIKMLTNVSKNTRINVEIPLILSQKTFCKTMDLDQMFQDQHVEYIDAKTQ